jgi:hypothetical protein
MLDSVPTSITLLFLFAICEQTGIRRDCEAAKLHYDATVEIELKNTGFGFTRRVPHVCLT